MMSEIIGVLSIIWDPCTEGVQASWFRSLPSPSHCIHLGSKAADENALCLSNVYVYLHIYNTLIIHTINTEQCVIKNTEKLIDNVKWFKLQN